MNGNRMELLFPVGISEHLNYRSVLTCVDQRNTWSFRRLHFTSLQDQPCSSVADPYQGILLLFFRKDIFVTVFDMGFKIFLIIEHTCMRAQENETEVKNSKEQ